MSGVERASSGRVIGIEALDYGTVEVLGLLPYSSNYAFLTKVVHEGSESLAVYKPTRGERPLWDFPHGTLAAREVGAYLVSEAGGFDLVPPTVLREDGPLGSGSLQAFVEHDPERHYFVLIHEREQEMAQFAVLDIVINNADRKGGHIIEGRDGKLWGVDHGLSFNVEPKLRTVVWAFAGRPLPDDLLERLDLLERGLAPGQDLAERLGALLSPEETSETRARAALLKGAGVFPEPEGPFHMPWPLI